MATPVKYRNGLTGTVLFHGMLLILLLYMAFRTPLPLPGEQGILVDFGNSNTGFGNIEPRMSDPAPVQPQATPPPASQSRDQILTQDMEETVALPANKPNETPRQTQTETPKQTQTETQPVEQPKPPERTVDTRAMYPGRGDATSSAVNQGEAGGQGNQGVPTGAPNVHVYGEGIDVGGGLTGRGIVGNLPKPVYNVQDQGVVVVSITVDRDGNVIAEEGSEITEDVIENAKKEGKMVQLVMKNRA